MKYILIVSLIVSGSFYPKKAEALIGIGGAAGAVLITLAWVGGGVTGVGLGIFSMSFADKIENKIGSLALKTLAVLLFIGGAFALDDPGYMQAQEISETNAVLYGITKDELESYNSQNQLAKINAINEAAMKILNDKLAINPNLSIDEQYEVVNNYINTEKAGLDSLTQSALNKIGEKTLKAMKENEEIAEENYGS